MANLDLTLAALADPTRRGVIELLRDKPLRASDIADALAMTRPAMSRHLRVLRQAGLVREDGLESDARARVYQLEREPLAQLGSWVEHMESFWTDQLAAFKAHAERPKRPVPRQDRRKP
jgi:DNA-binding transcriptional ArsR family regulator